MIWKDDVSLNHLLVNLPIFKSDNQLNIIIKNEYRYQVDV